MLSQLFKLVVHKKLKYSKIIPTNLNLSNKLFFTNYVRVFIVVKNRNVLNFKIIFQKFVHTTFLYYCVYLIKYYNCTIKTKGKNMSRMFYTVSKFLFFKNSNVFNSSKIDKYFIKIKLKSCFINNVLIIIKILIINNDVLKFQVSNINHKKTTAKKMF